MKKSMLFVIPFFLTIFHSSAQQLEPAPAEKAVIYFARPSSTGFAINFSYFDSTKLIGIFNGPKYIRYECDPGPHLFWARSENVDFIEAEVEAGKIYFIEAIPQMGAIKAAVKLHPVDPKDAKKMGKIFKLMNKKPAASLPPSELEAETVRLQDAIYKGMEKYEAEKKKGKINARLNPSIYYTAG